MEPRVRPNVDEEDEQEIDTSYLCVGRNSDQQVAIPAGWEGAKDGTEGKPSPAAGLPTHRFGAGGACIVRQAVPVAIITLH